MDAYTLIKNYWAAVNNRDWKSVDDCVTEDLVYTLPQRRERIRGKEAFVAFNAAYPGDWQIQLESVFVDGEAAISKILFVGHNRHDRRC